MRDDTIIVRGPFEIDDLQVPERVADDGTLVPARILDMSHMRRFELVSRACPCGRMHAYVIEVQWELMRDWPEFAEWSLLAGMGELKRAMRDCPYLKEIGL